MNHRDWGPGNPVWEDIQEEREIVARVAKKKMDRDNERFYSKMSSEYALWNSSYEKAE